MSQTTATQAPVIKSDQTQTKASTTAVKPDVKADAKSDAKKAMNANAAVTPSEHKSVRSHRHHHKMMSAKTSAATTQPSVGSKSTEPVTTGKAKSNY